MPASRLNPEQRARVRIDEMLEAAGWVILNYADADFAAGTGVAVREFMTPKGPVDYLLVADGKVVGSIEAKKEQQPPARLRPAALPLHLHWHRDPVHEPA